ncbi:putative secreted domain protein [Xanthomonas citri pv. mangiferaeindicae LMG 941]|nr:putative secreted domain protein [Xanthomonas citri pv. mangiferaeindicae LMG 941]
MPCRRCRWGHDTGVPVVGAFQRRRQRRPSAIRHADGGELCGRTMHIWRTRCMVIRNWSCIGLILSRRVARRWSGTGVQAGSRNPRSSRSCTPAATSFNS